MPKSGAVNDGQLKDLRIELKNRFKGFTTLYDVGKMSFFAL